MNIDYELNMDDFDSVDFIEYADEYYPREIYSQEPISAYWYYGEVF